jgi:hypothetical protein
MIANLEGFRIKEIPVEWRERVSKIKKSSINVLRDSLSFVINLIKYRLLFNSLKRNKK